jgi:hypothetical protein
MMDGKGVSNVGVVSGGCLGVGPVEVAFPEVKRDLVERELFPLFRFCQPEDFAFRIPQRALAAKKFLGANFDQLFHELHPCSVKPICRATLAESATERFNFLCGK